MATLRYRDPGTGQMITLGAATNDHGQLQGLADNDHPQYLLKSGGTMTGPLTVVGNIEAGDSGGKVGLESAGGRRMVTGRLADGTLRWTLRLGDATGSPETGGNAGSDFFLYAYNDAGVFLNTPIRIYRNTGLMVLAGDPTTALGAATKGYVDNKGVWTTYTPSFNAAVTIGNGSVSGRYTRIGDTVHFEAKLVLGTTSSLSGSQVRLTLPPVAKLSGTLGSYTAKLANSAAYWTLATFAMSATEVSVDVIDTKGVATAMSSTNPTTIPGTGATIYLTGTYEAA